MKKEHEIVQKAYGEVARRQSSCCGPRQSCCAKGPAVAGQPVPEAELGLSCGNPVAFSHLREGQVVLDLGSGAGKDVFLAAQKVGPSGRVIGVDMTQDMLQLARRNAEKFTATTGLSNVEFREGLIERLPVEDNAVDLVISNCVINLSPDKAQVFREVFRVLKPGGRMVISDIVLERPLPEHLRSDQNLYASCIAGALLRKDYLSAITAAGFGKVDVLSDHLYANNGAGDHSETLNGVAASITVMAQKASGCGCSCRCPQSE
jgi:SAM-dependent methyltransferase